MSEGSKDRVVTMVGVHCPEFDQVGYDALTKTLRVLLKSNAVVEFTNVPEEVYTALLAGDANTLDTIRYAGQFVEAPFPWIIKDPAG